MVIDICHYYSNLNSSSEPNIKEIFFLPLKICNLKKASKTNPSVMIQRLLCIVDLRRDRWNNSFSEHIQSTVKLFWLTTLHHTVRDAAWLLRIKCAWVLRPWGGVWLQVRSQESEFLECVLIQPLRCNPEQVTQWLYTSVSNF